MKKTGPIDRVALVREEVADSFGSSIRTLKRKCCTSSVIENSAKHR